jgi:hypothetical protein
MERVMAHEDNTTPSADNSDDSTVVGSIDWFRSRASREEYEAFKEKAKTEPPPCPPPEPDKPETVINDAGEAPAPAGTGGRRDLTDVPGVLGECISWMVESARRPNRMLALGASLTTGGTLIGRRIAGPTRSGTHLYTVALADTSAGKQHVLNGTKQLLESAGAAALIGPERFASSQAVVNFVKRKPLSLCAMDEFGAFLSRIGDPRANPNEAAISGELRKLWGISFDRFDSAESAHVVSQAVYSPALSIFGVSTLEEFYCALRAEDVGNGFLNRFFILEAGERGPENDPPAGSEKVPTLLKGRLEKLYHPFDVLRTDGSGSVEPETIMGWSSSAKDLYFELSRRTDEEQDEQQRKLKGRVAELAIRAATIRAALQFASKIKVDDMEWGCDLATLSAETLCAGVLKYMTQRLEFSVLVPEIVKRVRARGGEWSERDIRRSFERLVSRGMDIDWALKHLLESEQMDKTVTYPSSLGGRPSITWKLRE